MKNFPKKIVKHFMKIIRRVKLKKSIEMVTKSTPKYGLNVSTRRNDKIIISLTSYSKRFSTLPLCLKTLLYQTVKPDKIILYLSKKDCSNITEETKELKKYGIEIKIVKEDFRPHKKYFYVMQEYPNSIIITVDDDIIYDKYLVERLLKTHYKYPNAIVADRARIIKVNQKGFLPYNSWQLASNFTKPSLNLLATGVGGVLYPPHLLNSKLLFNIKFIEKYIIVDDLWLKTVEILNNIPTVTSNKNCNHQHYIEIPSVQKTGLFINENENKNDEYWAQLDEEFDLFNKLK